MKKTCLLLLSAILSLHAFSQTLQSVMQNGNTYSNSQALLPAFSGNSGYGVLGAFSNDANGYIQLLASKTESNRAALAISNSFDFYTYNNNSSWTRFLTHNAANGFSINLVPDGGYVGIGTTAPAEVLHVNGNIISHKLANEDRYINIQGAGDHRNYGLQFSGHWRLYDNTDGTPTMLTPNANWLFVTGNVLVGYNGQRDLEVNGNIKTRKIKVTQTGWADDVFDPTYTLMPLQELDKFINLHKHLPDVPTAQTVAKEGVDVGENQALLLRKVEELTLYLLEEHKKNEMLIKKVAELEKKLDKH